MSDQASAKDDTKTVAEITPESDENLWDEFETSDAKSAPPEKGSEEQAFEEEAPPADTAGDKQQDTPSVIANDATRAEVERLAAENAKIEQRIRSDQGRKAAHQRRIDELVAQAQPRSRQERQDDADALKALETDYPEIAEPLKKISQSVNIRLDKIDEDGESRRKAAETELNDLLAAEEQRLDGLAPDWRDVLKANGKTYNAWIEDQPKRLRDLAARNADAITDADSAAEVLTAFKEFLQPPAPPSRNLPLNDRRQRQKTGASSPQTSGGRATVAGIPEDGDPEAIWDAFEVQDAAKAARGHV